MPKVSVVGLIAIDRFMPIRGPYRNRVSNKGKENTLKKGKKNTLRHYSMLELYEGKLSRTVLRRGNGGNSVPLAGGDAGDYAAAGILSPSMSMSGYQRLGDVPNELITDSHSSPICESVSKKWAESGQPW